MIILVFQIFWIWKIKLEDEKEIYDTKIKNLKKEIDNLQEENKEIINYQIRIKNLEEVCKIFVSELWNIL